jgi:hypothetical protein
MSAAAKPQLKPALVTKAEILELARLEARHETAKKMASGAEKEVGAARLSLVEKVLGVTGDELKKLDPAKVEKLFAQRMARGLWIEEKGCPLFRFVKTNEGRYPAWAALYVEEMGESAAARVKVETEPTYSYKVDVPFE